MGRQDDKRWERFYRLPNDYTIREAFTLLESIGHTWSGCVGSAATFTNKEGKQPVHFHLPHHPSKTFKRKTVKDIYNQLAGYNLLKKINK